MILFMRKKTLQEMMRREAMQAIVDHKKCCELENELIELYLEYLDVSRPFVEIEARQTGKTLQSIHRQIPPKLRDEDGIPLPNFWCDYHSWKDRLKGLIRNYRTKACLERLSPDKRDEGRKPPQPPTPPSIRLIKEGSENPE